MGTNYFLRVNNCKECGRYEEVHIGKKSFGWKFVFSIDLGHSYKDVMKLLEENKNNIYNEYNENVFLDKFKKIVEESQSELTHNTYNNNYTDEQGYDFCDRDFR